MVPLDREAPVDPDTGALAVGVPVPDTVCTVVDPGSGRELGPGEVGELCLAGPQVVPGYWRNEAASRDALRGGRLHTGDVGKRDAAGWFYVVDRLKDQINVSGFKVWPREVEDALYRHPAVREAAVVGVPDAYRGETVKAFVALRAGATATPADLQAFVRGELAAYKCPREVEILDELPRTATGKFLRRELRARPS
jgi:long-chain acyl-CoA synthetase